MYTRQDLSQLDPRVPEDYEERSKEFWDYVDQRLSAISGRLKKVYLESTGVAGKRHLEMLKVIDPRQHDVVKRAVDAGSELVEAENPELVLETLSWMQKMQELVARGGEQDASALQAIAELLRESMKERDESVKETIETTLGDGEAGALVMDISREINLAPDIRVVTTCPFQPRDYLESWLATLSARDAREKEESEGEKGEAAEEERDPEETGQ
jgi:hypothetical protein